MGEQLPKYCDNTSVGVIITNGSGHMALLTRARFPAGIAPPGGHVDDHGSILKAAVSEVFEELGLTIREEDLAATAIMGRRIDNRCRRENGGYHVWHIFEANGVEGELRPSPDETKGAGWYSSHQIQELVDRTRQFQAGEIDQATWEANPGLEEVWLDFLTELGYLAARNS